MLAKYHKNYVLYMILYVLNLICFNVSALYSPYHLVDLWIFFIDCSFVGYVHGYNILRIVPYNQDTTESSTTWEINYWSVSICLIKRIMNNITRWGEQYFSLSESWWVMLSSYLVSLFLTHTLDCNFLNLWSSMSTLYCLWCFACLATFK